ncbi:MAG: AsmA family protein [Bdellovibrionales bacterium]|nr:AsmA family protein [Bdellovibrionales bacterium]
MGHNPKIEQNKSVTSSLAPLGGVWFIVAILVAFFLGGSVRVLLSERQIRHWVVSVMSPQLLPMKVQFSHARVKLADGWWPRVGLEFKNLKFYNNESENGPFEVILYEVFCPLSLSDLLQKKVRLGLVQVQGGSLWSPQLQSEVGSSQENLKQNNSDSQHQENHDIHFLAKKLRFDPDSPTFKLEANEQKSPFLKGQKENKELWGRWENKITDFLKMQWPDFWNRFLNKIDGIEISNLKILGPFPNQDFVDFSHLRILFNSVSQRIALMGSLNPTSVWYEVLGRTPVIFKINISQSSLDHLLEIPMREGKVVSSGQIQLQKKEYTGLLQVANVPALQIVEGFQRFHIIEMDNFQPKRLWVNGKFIIKGSFSNLFVGKPSLDIRGENFILVGSGGILQIKDWNFFPLEKKEKFSKFSVDFRHFSIQQILESVDRRGYSGVIGNFGFLNGTLQIFSGENASFKGEMTDLDILFSRQSIQEKQKVSRLEGRLELKTDKIYGFIDQVDLENGQSDIQARFQLDKNFLNGWFHLNIKQLKFNSAVEKLMLRGEMNDVTLQGTGNLYNGHLKNWIGKGSVGILSGKDCRAQQFKIESVYKNEKVQLKVSVMELLWENMPKGFKGLDILWKEWRKSDGRVAVQNVKGQLSVDGSNWNWDLKGKIPQSLGSKFLSRGSWSKGHVEGEMKVGALGNYKLKGFWPEVLLME